MAASQPMINVVCEYVWIDGEQNLRSKIKVLQKPELKDFEMFLEDFPKWNFDGSSTGQSVTKKSDLILNPVYFTKNPLISSSENLKNLKSYLVLCEIVNHPTNNFEHLKKIYYDTFQSKSLFGIEQEYMICSIDGSPYEFNSYNSYNSYNVDKEKYNPNQHYCTVGTNKAFGRSLVMEHFEKCLEAGLMIGGINSEVTPSQWEFQIGPLNAFEVSHQLWLARYILIQLAEKYNAVISFHPKPYPTLNGSGAHTNFSTHDMRCKDGISYIYEAIDKLSKNHTEHIKVYGLHNELRLLGTHETANINTFSYGQCDRSSSIRIPINVMEEKCGYLEDRRPASNMDPYLVTARILKTVVLDIPF